MDWNGICPWTFYNEILVDIDNVKKIKNSREKKMLTIKDFEEDKVYDDIFYYAIPQGNDKCSDYIVVYGMLKGSKALKIIARDKYESHLYSKEYKVKKMLLEFFGEKAEMLGVDTLEIDGKVVLISKITL